MKKFGWCVWVLVFGMGSVCAQPEDYISPDSVSINLKTTHCYGTCPVYELTIDGYGHVTYNGKEHVEKKGVHKTKIGQEQVVDLLNDFIKVRFFDQPASFTTITEIELIDGGNYEYSYMEITDLPSTYLELKLGHQQHRIKMYAFVPDDLVSLAARVRTTAGVDAWVGE